MAQLYLIVTASSPGALSDLITGSLANGYTLVGDVFTTGSVYGQSLMLQSVNKDNYNVNRERLSKNFRQNVTGSDQYAAPSVFQ